MEVVFSSVYAGNLDYYSCLLKADKFRIDVHENYIKHMFFDCLFPLFFTSVLAHGIPIFM